MLTCELLNNFLYNCNGPDGIQCPCSLGAEVRKMGATGFSEQRGI